MNRLTRTALVSLALLLGVTPVAHADGLATISYGDNCWGSGVDADSDGLNDDCEYQLAYWFMPLLWFDSGESGLGRRPYYSVKSVSFASRTVRIFYLDTFFDDTGVTTGHDGDPEFQILEVHASGGRWYLDWAYLSAHRKSSCDSSAWYSHDQLEYDTAIDSRNAYRGWPTLYVAEDKHATYNNLSTCDKGCLLQDYCSRTTYQWLDTTSKLVSRNVGSTTVQLINQIVLNGKTERLLDDAAFKGWDDQWYRPNSQGYGRHLTEFGF